MPSGKQAVSCIPCAKRKVRCDKVQPCCHCKRRRQDTCVYPEQLGASAQLLRGQNDRIEKLEQYIRALGGDPKHADGTSDTISPEDRNAYPEAGGATDAQRSTEPDSTPWTQTQHEGASSERRPRRAVPGESELLAHGDGVTYIETPMWYSWKGHDNPPTHHALSPSPGNQAPQTHNLPTILNQRHTLYGDGVFTPLPCSVHLDTLWPVFLTNVHPLVKIFFDWETAPLIQKAQATTLSLSKEEEALVNGIKLVAALTLTPEECQTRLSEARQELLQQLQKSVEHALTEAEYSETTDKRVLQALILYILAMRDRTRPSAVYSLMGVAGRVAERMGLHRDGTTFGLSALRSEERRRIWWQLQAMEIAVARLVGALSLSLFANWDTKVPSNLEDSDFNSATEVMPVERKGLTSISPCLWRYSILQRRRELLGKNDTGDLSWMLSPHMPLAKKDAMIDELERFLAEKFLQHCELVNPLHVHLQIGIRLFGLAARSNVRQPTLVNAKISEFPPEARKDLLDICMKSLEYFVLSQTTPSILGFRWGNDIYFQVPSFVYVILEAHQRSGESQVEDLWDLIGRVYEAHPNLMVALDRPEVDFLARITVAAWQRYDVEMRQARTSAVAMETPAWIRQLCSNFNLPVTETTTATEDTQSLNGDMLQFLPENFDFDIIDWSAWEALR